jgi:hypothetical protein
MQMWPIAATKRNSVDLPLRRFFIMSDVSDQQLAAFHATHYRVDGPNGSFVLRTGAHSRELQQLHESHGAVSSAYITAWNPLGGIVPPETNAQSQQALRRDLAELGVPVLPGEGRDPESGWAEQSLLAIGLSRAQAIMLGNRYRQLAILFAGQDAIPGLVLLR